MNSNGRIGYFILTLGVILLGVGVSSVAAETITSPSYKINGNLGGSFGGQTNSTNYKMTAIGGESIVGSGSSGSYIIDQQLTNPTTPSMQLAVQPSGLVGYYPMDENTGMTAADASRYQNNGTFKVSSAWNAIGKLGSAADIVSAGSGNGSIAVPDHSNLPSGTQMTIEAWVNARTLDDGYIATHWGASVSESWRLSLSFQDIWFKVAAAQSGGTSSTPRTTGDVFNSINIWRHIAVTFDGSLAMSDRVKIYIDGVQQSLVDTSNIPEVLQNSSANLSIGAYNNIGIPFPGLIDHVKIFNRSLSAAEIKAEYNAQNAGASTGFGLAPTPGNSITSDLDAIVRTNREYTISVQQDNDLQKGADYIPAVGGSIASPAIWDEGVTKGLGFTLTGAPTLDGKWNSGAKYAAIPSSATTFYSSAGYGAVDVLSLRLRLDVTTAQTAGVYSNALTYTGTMTP